MLHRSADIAHAVLISCLVVQKITECDEFLRSHSQRALAINTVMAVLEDEVLLLDLYTRCSSSHEPITLVKMAVFEGTKILLNIYCFVKNDVLEAKKLAKKENYELFVK